MRVKCSATSENAAPKTSSMRVSTAAMTCSRSRREARRSSSWSLRKVWRSAAARCSSSASGFTGPSSPTRLSGAPLRGQLGVRSLAAGHGDADRRAGAGPRPGRRPARRRARLGRRAPRRAARARCAQAAAGDADQAARSASISRRRARTAPSFALLPPRASSARSRPRRARQGGGAALAGGGGDLGDLAQRASASRRTARSRSASRRSRRWPRTPRGDPAPQLASDWSAAPTASRRRSRPPCGRPARLQRSASRSPACPVGVARRRGHLGPCASSALRRARARSWAPRRPSPCALSRSRPAPFTSVR